MICKRLSVRPLQAVRPMVFTLILAVIGQTAPSGQTDGWDKMAQIISTSHKKLLKEKGINAGIFTDNWGQASAIYIHGKQYNLPIPISKLAWFYQNAIDNHSFKEDYIVIGFDSISLVPLFNKIEKIDKYTHKY